MLDVKITNLPVRRLGKLVQQFQNADAKDRSNIVR
jgi:hypothetical protein